MGLERVTAVIQGKRRTTTPTCHADPRRHRRPRRPRYRATLDDPSDVPCASSRIYLRAMTFSRDGVMPSTDWRGYVLRKIMRRARCGNGKNLGFREPVLHELVDGPSCARWVPRTRELTASRDAIARVVRSGRSGFDAVLTAVLPRPRRRSIARSRIRHGDVGRRGVSASTTRSARPLGSSWRTSQEAEDSQSIGRDTTARWKASA